LPIANDPALVDVNDFVHCQDPSIWNDYLAKAQWFYFTEVNANCDRSSEFGCIKVNAIGETRLMVRTRQRSRFGQIQSSDLLVAIQIGLKATRRTNVTIIGAQPFDGFGRRHSAPLTGDFYIAIIEQIDWHWPQSSSLVWHLE
jgi:hypothetical protein